MIYANIWQKRFYHYAYWLLGILGLVIIFAGALEANAQTYATFDSASCSVDISLSNGNLTATKTGGAAWKTCRGNISKSTGKWFWEWTFTGGTEVIWGVGAGNIADGNYPGYNNSSWGWYIPNNKVYNNSFTSYGTFASGDVISVLLDLDNNTLEYWVNGVSQGQAFASGVSGTLYPQIAINGDTDNVVANFGATAFSTSVPAGYNAGWYTESGGTTTTSSTIDYNIDDFILVYKEKLLLIGGSLLMLGFCVMIIKVKQGVILPKKKL